MKKKKFLALILALAMIFSMSLSAFADSDTGDSDTGDSDTGDSDTGNTDTGNTEAGDDDMGNLDFEAVATVQVPAISVKVPSTQGTLFINPMGFALKVEDGTAATAADKADTTIKLSSEKVISPVYMIENESPMKLDVLVNGMATLGSGVEGAEAPTALAIAAAYPFASDNTKNEVAIYAQFKAETAAKAVTTEVRNAASVDKKAYTSKAPGEDQFGVSTKTATAAKKVGQLVAATASSGATQSGLMYFQFFGDCNPNAKTAWNEGDALTVALTFTFQPVTT